MARVLLIAIVGALLALPQPLQAGRSGRVALVSLIVNAGDYDTKRVRIVAWCSIEEEGAAAFMNETDYWFLVAENGVALNLSNVEKLPLPDRGVYEVSGEFRSSDPLRGFAGTIVVDELTKLGSLERLRELGNQLDP